MIGRRTNRHRGRWLATLLAVVLTLPLAAARTTTPDAVAAPATPGSTTAPAEVAAAPRAVVGDFDADLRADLVWYGKGSAADHAWFGAPGRRFAGEPITVGGDYLPLVGDFNGDRHDDIFWYGPGRNSDYLWFGGQAHGFVGRRPVVDGRYQPFVADFDGDRRDDIFWYQPGRGVDVVWYGTSRGSFEGLAATVPGSPAPVIGDYDGNGTADIVWYGEGDAWDAVWRGVRGGGFTGRSLRIRLSYTPRAGDFNADGRDDVFWFGRGSAPDVLWTGAGGGGFFGRSMRADAGNAPLVGDFDGNGATDLFWYQPGTPPDPVWYGHRAGFTRRPATVNGDYQPIVADFDGDWRTDVLWFAPGAPLDPLWYGVGDESFASKSSIVDIHPALAPPVDLARVRADYDRFGVLAHEMGPTPQRDGYTSSLEAFNYNYERGFRVFEADFVRLADGAALATHDGFEPYFGLNRPFNQVTRADIRRMYMSGNSYTPLFSDDVVRLMVLHPDIYVVLDTKDSDVAIFTRFLRDAGGDPAIMERLIPHVYDQTQLTAIQDLYPVHNYMVALYRSQWYNRFDDDAVVSFVRRNRAPAVMMWSGFRNTSLSLRDNMSQQRRYTHNLAGRLSAARAVSWVHSIYRVPDAIAFKARGVAIYSSAPFPPYDETQPELIAPEDESDEYEP